MMTEIYKFKHFKSPYNLRDKDALNWTICTNIEDNKMRVGYVVLNPNDGKFIKKTATAIAQSRCSNTPLIVDIPNLWPHTHHMLTVLALKAIQNDLRNSNPYNIPANKAWQIIQQIERMIDRRLADYMDDLEERMWTMFNRELSDLEVNH